ncbi:uncharacterized protein BDCG_17839 [Blastomyces dermatitidis ER-3]|uniref:Uncharacterized protein n=1 Tax=Ajellomyces dermatitidis (strain ER-3 / ATCC MYA-2586) TaxID=559297 RepID=A0ABX2W0M2_AJEDR|nr:uncharacterized protein BDCG_17839 [Blastomyces dermatitidis ER-3]OAT02934.1 hypothetical protein BDCG_17839 [Blastomyces dermatitidis ER-3]
MAHQHCISSPVDSDSAEDMMNVNDNDDDNDDSDGIASDSSREINLTDSANYRKDSKNDISNLTDLLTGDKHLSEYYINIMTDSDEFLLQYNKYVSNSQKLLDCIKQE